MDPLSDMLIRVKNARTAGKGSIQIPYSKFKHEIAKFLSEKEFVGKVERKGKRVKKFLEVELPPKQREGGLKGVRLLSTPGRRLYAPYRKLPRSIRGGIVILSTSRGIMAANKARREKIGGEIIAEVW
jgi:small subunit ribosomal protein S8